MRISCPYCGDRDQHEFVYRGDAALERPDPAAGEAVFAAYVYERANLIGEMAEHWYHAQGCRNWLVVVRNTRTHLIKSVRVASEAS